MRTALSIAGSDPSGGAGIQADIKTMTANGVYAMTAVTALTAQNTVGVSGIFEVSPEFAGEQLDRVFEDIFPDAVKIGMVSSAQITRVIAEKLKKYNAKNIVLDTVMVATSGAKLISDEAIEALKTELIPLADIITPNIPEAEVLSGMKIASAEDMELAAEEIFRKYGCAVLLKGGHQLNDANDLLFGDGIKKWYNGRRIDNPNTHGTGCTLSSAIASNLAKGFDIDEAVERAKKYISGALGAMLDLGRGSGPMDHTFAIENEFTAERNKKMREYSTQMEAAKKGIITPEMKIVAEKEYISPEELRELVAKGEVAIPCNINHKAISPEGVGTKMRTKINVNLGISGDAQNYDKEMQKVELAHKFGAEAIMDLSNYGKTNTFRRQLIEKSPAMIGTVPMYDAIGYLEKDLLDITAEDFLKVVRAHAEEGVDFMTIHAGINRRAVEAFRREGRKMNIVSRGGSLLFAWMMMTGNENPFYEHYDEVLEILREFDVTISLGDALRPGCIDDATDAGQISELIELGALTLRAWEKDVQVMVEGPGHMAMNEIAANMTLQKRICHNAPFYVLGPLVTDIFPGYDHITTAIGGAIAAASGADFLCYVTPAEHLRLPDVDDVKEGIMASKIAAHAADIAKGVPHARDKDNAMAEARHKVDWDEMFKIAADPDKAREYFESTPPADRHTCSMCGKMCAVRTTNMILEGKTVEFCTEK